nr:hypothetical protein [Lachnospiraceae bacterium]
DLKRFREDPRSIFNVGNTIGSPSAVIVRRSDVTYDERLTWLVDMEYYIHLLSESGSFASTDEPLISIGVSDRQLTRKVSEDEELVKRERGIISEKYGIEDRAEKGEGLSVEGLLFYAGLTLEILWVILDKSAYIIESEGILFRMSFVPLFLSVVIGFFKRRYGKRDCIYFAAFFVLGVISYLCSSRNDIIRILFLVFASANASPKKYLRYTFFVTLSGCIVLSLLSFTGILGTVMTDKEVGEGVTRRLLTLGMGHPNSLFAMFFALTALGLFIWYDRFNLKWGLLLLFADAGLFFMTASRMGFVCTAMSILFTLLMKKSASLRDGKWFYHISSAVIILMAVLSLMTAKYGEIYNSYDPPWFEPHFETVMKPLDRYMSGRLWNAYGYPDSDISRFSAFSSPENTRYVDMGYYKLFYWYGYVPGWIYVGICIALLMVSCRKKIPALGVFVAVWCFYNFMEAHEISDFIGRNYIWLMSFYLPGLFLGRGDVSV